VARDFDGSNDNVTNNNGVSNIDVAVRTIFCWTNIDSLSSQGGSTFYTGSEMTGGNSADSITFDDGSNLWQYTYRWSSTSGQWRIGTAVVDVWVSLGCDYDRGSVSNDPNIYRDGVLQSETENTTPAGSAKTGVDSIRFGENVGGGGDYNGQTAHGAIWDIALTASEELALFHGVPAFVVRNESLQMYFPLNGNESPEAEYMQQITGSVAGSAKAATSPNVELLENYL